MKTLHKVLIVVCIILAAGWILLQKNAVDTDTLAVNTADTGGVAPQQGAVLPQLIDLGADKCIPCKMMAPILEELRQTYTGRMTVRFIDVWKNPGAGQEFGIRVIPTQIFIDAAGRERFRHEGFYSKEDILGKWRELGVDLRSE